MSIWEKILNQKSKDLYLQNYTIGQLGVQVHILFGNRIDEC
jgi:hypothetical protein